MRYLVLGVCIFAAACAGGVPSSPTSLTGTAEGSAQTQAQSGTELPFRGSLQAVEANQLAPPLLLVNGTGEGTATHLGRFTATYQATVVLATSSGTGSLTFIAANGDRVFATDTGHAVPTAPGVVTITEIATITGGTGRFAGATGGFTIERVLHQATGVSSGSFDGTISLAH